MIGALAARGLVTVRHGRRMEVRPVSEWNHLDPLLLELNHDPESVRRTLGDLHDLRMLLEPEIAARAALMATGEQLERMRHAIERMEELAGRPRRVSRDRRRLPQRARRRDGQRRARLRARLGARAPAREPARHEPDQRACRRRRRRTGASTTRSSPTSRRRHARRCARICARSPRSGLRRPESGDRSVIRTAEESSFADRSTRTRPCARSSAGRTSIQEVAGMSSSSSAPDRGGDGRRRSRRD